MTSKIAIQRINNALEKQDTFANANFTRWDKEDALNKAMNDWVRRQINGMNLHKEGSEESSIKVDDLQVLLIPDKKMSVSQDTNLYADTTKIPDNYRYYNKLTLVVSKGDCENVQMKSTFVENANVDDYLQDYTFSPSFDFEQAFHVMVSNKFRIFHDDDFHIDEVILSYYRSPKKISTELKDFDNTWEWKDDVAEMIIDEAVKLLAGNIESQNAFQLASKRVEETT